jgi:hypothetical protein
VDQLIMFFIILRFLVSPLLLCEKKGVSAMGIPTILKRRLSALTLMLFASTLAMAQYDEGQYQILRALYGTARNNVDVTERLKELARKDTAFRMGNSTFGVDPDPGVIKILRIYARGRNGQNRMFEYTEGSTVDGSLFTGWDSGTWKHGEWKGGWDDRNGDEGQYEILHARYGTARGNVDVTERLRELARRDLTFRMGNSTFGVDPDPGVIKILRIYARGRNGQDRMFEYTEGSTVDGSLFSGWSGGDWPRDEWKRGWGDDNNVRIGGGGDHTSLNIISATYGAGKQRRDVTDRVRSMIREGLLRITVNNDTMGGDPVHNVRKALWVTYSTSRERAQEVRVDEGERLSVP